MSALATEPVAGRVLAAGVDVGSSAVKTAVMAVEPDESASILALRCDRIHRREVTRVIHESFATAIEEAGVQADQLDYVASTGEGELVDFRRGHFYGMTTHARGAVFLEPRARAVLDVGALHARAMRIDERSKVLGYRMTSQCASGSGQFLENVARYLGVALDEVGSLSRQAREPEAVSSICAVLAETDVINMVSRGISTSNILKGIHQSMAGRYIKLLRAIGAGDAEVLLTGGLAADAGLAQAMRERVAEDEMKMVIHAHPHSVYAGALGAALWGGFRHKVLARRAQGASA